MNWEERCQARLFSSIKEANDALDQEVGNWHDSDSQQELHEYLGMSWERYARLFQLGVGYVLKTEGLVDE